MPNNSRAPQLAFAERASDSGGTGGVLSCNRFAILASEAEPEQEAVAGQVRVPSRRVALVPQSAQGTPRSIQDVAASHFDLTSQEATQPRVAAFSGGARRGGSKQFQC